MFQFEPPEAPSPPPLHFSSSTTADRDPVSTRDSTPVTTPIGFGVPSRRPARETDRDLWPRNPDEVDSSRSSYFDYQPLQSHIHSDSDFPLFAPSTPSSSKMTGSAAPIDIATRQSSVSPPGQQASNLTSALQNAGKSERTSSISHANGVGISVFKAPPPRKESISAATAQWGGGTKPISVSGASRDRPRRESLAGSLVGGMSWGGVSVGSWIRDE
jgi:transcription factor SFP1